jgi:hypothetical protein
MYHDLVLLLAVSGLALSFYKSFRHAEPVQVDRE